MPDIPTTPETAPETAPGPTPDATPQTPAGTDPAAPVAAAAPAPRPDPSVGDTARLLAQHFPALFGAGVIKPIKLRIQADIHQRAPGVFTRKALSVFLQRHTTATAYLRALVAEGATRTDLDGQPAGDIAAEHRDAARVELDRRRAIVDAKRQAGRERARASRQDARPPQPGSEQAEGSQSASPATRERPATRGAPSVPGTSNRPDRSPRPSQPEQARRRARTPRPGAPRDPARPGDAGPLAPRHPHKPRPERKLAGARDPGPVNAAATPQTPAQAAEAEARRQRALLLRSFEQSPLSKANFAALKGLSEGALNELLTLAQQERG
jgi:ProP effector